MKRHYWRYDGDIDSFASLGFCDGLRYVQIGKFAAGQN
jgi:hypothetical protein